MNAQNRFDFFERLYFHELEAREQMTTRVQIPLALLISTIGALGFMAQNLDREVTGAWLYSFNVAFILAIVLIVLSGYYCVKSAWGHEYAMTSFAVEWEDYHKSCETTYQGESEDKRDSLVTNAFRECIQKKYIECATKNAAVNADRSFKYYLTIKYFLWAIALVSAAFIFYFFGSLDKSSRTKPTEVRIVSSDSLKGFAMSNNNPSPPLPPPPPPTRYVRDDRPSTPPPKKAPNGK